ITYADHVWTEGMEQWKRISEIDELSVSSKPKAPEISEEIPAVNYEVPADQGEDLLKRVETLERTQPDFPQYQSEPIPEEAGTKDLVGTLDDLIGKNDSKPDGKPPVDESKIALETKANFNKAKQSRNIKTRQPKKSTAKTGTNTAIRKGESHGFNWLAFVITFVLVALSAYGYRLWKNHPT